MTSSAEPIGVDVDGGRITVLDWGGSGRPVVLLHPNGFCAGLYDPVATQLLDDAHVVGVDLPGHGASTPPADRAGFGFGVMAEAHEDSARGAPLIRRHAVGIPDANTLAAEG